MDVLAILRKIRDSYGMLRFLRGKQHKALLRFNKDRTVALSESESSSDDIETLNGDGGDFFEIESE